MKQITRHVSGDAGCMYACSRAAARTDPVLRGRARPKLVNSKTGTLPVPVLDTFFRMYEVWGKSYATS